MRDAGGGDAVGHAGRIGGCDGARIADLQLSGAEIGGLPVPWFSPAICFSRGRPPTPKPRGSGRTPSVAP
jgi:hypothetical protein